MQIQLPTHEWLKLPMEVRVKLREIFNIPKSEGARVVNNTVESDGHTFRDLQALTVEKMQSYLDSKEDDFVKLFDEVLAKVDAELHPATPEFAVIDHKQLLVDEWAATFSRIKGQAAEKAMEDYLASLLERIFNLKPTVIPQLNAEQPQKRRPGRPKKAK